MTEKNCPTVSVIVPTYNRAHLIGRTIRSVLNQTFPDFELIVVDDASIDDTKNVVASFGDPRIRYIRRRQNGWASAARNTGIKAAQGKYICFLDSDDEYLLTMLERKMYLFANNTSNELGAVQCGVIIMLNSGEQKILPPFLKNHSRDDVLSLRGGTNVNSLCFARQCFDRGLLFDENLPCSDDRDFILRFLQQRWRVDFIDEPLQIYHHHNGPRTSDALNKIQGRLRLLQKYGDELKKKPAMYSRHHFKIAKYYYYSGNVRDMQRHLWQAIKLCPWHPRWYFLLLFSLGGEKVLKNFFRLYKHLY
jgi:glycosyltransferase involved in cell wall biosynthesis